MAWATGTADDFIDFLRKLRDYASGAIDPGSDPDFTDGVVVPSSDQWIVLPNGGDMPAIPGSGFATDGEVYLQGPGSDPSDEIVVGIKTYRNAGANIFGWNQRGFTGFNTSSDWDSLPGRSPDVLTALDDAAFDFFMYVNNRRIMAVARIGTTDILIHLGFIQQYGTRNQYPYPLLIAGSARSTAVSFQTNTYAQSCLPDPCENGAQLRWVDGTWSHFRNYTGTSDQRALARTSTGNVLWPQRNSSTSASGTESTSNVISEDALFEQFSTGSSLYISPAEVDLYPIFPSTLMTESAIVGRVDGLFTVYGLGLVKGDTFTDSSESPPVTYDVFGNTWRSEPLDFFAIRRE